MLDSSQNGWFIRSAREGDVRRLTHVRNTPNAFQEYLGLAGGEAAHFLVCERQRKLLAFALLLLRQPPRGTLAAAFPRINDLFVAPHVRSCGIGSRMIAHMEALAAGAGHTEIYLSVDPVKNPRAAVLYGRLGYVPVNGDSCRKTAIYYDEAGNAQEIVYWRMEMVKQLGIGDDSVT